MQPDPQLIAQLGQCDSATVANAIEHFAVRDPTTGYADNRLVCQRPEIARPMIGYAITCTADTRTPTTAAPPVWANSSTISPPRPNPLSSSSSTGVATATAPAFSAICSARRWIGSVAPG